MSKYLLKFQPLEYYFFGGENTFRINKKSDYYISSLPYPSMTTIIGALRYEVLKQNGALKIDGKYDSEQKKKCNALIGEASYCVEGDNSFGAIKDISPLFITMGDDILIHTPKNRKANKDKSVYEPIVPVNEYKTSCGNIKISDSLDLFDAKQTVYETDFIKLSDKSVVNDLFSEDEKIGIDKNKKDDAFFKMKMVNFNLKKYKDCAFAVVAELDDSITFGDSVCYMGRARSAFKLTVEKTDLDIKETVRTALSEKGGHYYYLLGDVFLKDSINYSASAMISLDTTRMLSTEINDGVKISCCPKIYQYISAGSVFYADDINNSKYPENYGYNTIIEIGGNN